MRPGQMDSPGKSKNLNRCMAGRAAGQKVEDKITNLKDFVL